MLTKKASKPKEILLLTKRRRSKETPQNAYNYLLFMNYLNMLSLAIMYTPITVLRTNLYRKTLAAIGGCHSTSIKQRNNLVADGRSN